MHMAITYAESYDRLSVLDALSPSAAAVIGAASGLSHTCTTPMSSSLCNTRHQDTEIRMALRLVRRDLSAFSVY